MEGFSAPRGGVAIALAAIAACSVVNAPDDPLPADTGATEGNGGQTSAGGSDGGAGPGGSGGSDGGAGPGGGSASGGSGPGGGGASPCGNGVVDPGETCDGDCPTSCIDPDLCTANVLTGDPDDCNVECAFNPIVTCMGGDGCCPAGCFQGNDFDCDMNVLVIGSGNDNDLQGVKNALEATNQFQQVNTFLANNAAIPPTAQLQNTDAVLVFVNFGLQDPNPLGDVLADYFDQGDRRVVMMNGANCHQTFRVRGRFEDDGYHVLNEGGVFPNPAMLGTVEVPNSPLWAGINPNFAINSVHCATDTPPGAMIIARYQETNAPITAVLQVNGSNRVDVNAYPGTGGDITNPDVVKLMVTALKYPLTGN